MQCPTYARLLKAAAPKLTPSLFQVGYWYNGAELTRESGGWSGLRVADLPRGAAQTWAMADTGEPDNTVDGFLERAEAEKGYVSAGLHAGGGGNCLFVGGHVRWKRATMVQGFKAHPLNKTLYASSSPTTKPDRFIQSTRPLSSKLLNFKFMENKPSSF